MLLVPPKIAWGWKAFPHMHIGPARDDGRKEWVEEGPIYSPKKKPAAAAATTTPLLRTMASAPLLVPVLVAAPEELVAVESELEEDELASSRYSAPPSPVQVFPLGQQP